MMLQYFEPFISHRNPSFSSFSPAVLASQCDQIAVTSDQLNSSERRIHHRKNINKSKLYGICSYLFCKKNLYALNVP